MKRNIIQIDQEKCNGCGLCISACHDGALALVDGKARLISESYCDGLGDCLPECPADAISIIEREAEAFAAPAPGSPAAAPVQNTFTAAPSQLQQWPVQIKLMPARAPYYEQANLLIAADCAAFSRASFHQDFMKDKITIIGCPKLDAVDYADKLTAILTQNDIKRLTVVRMEVPCCGGLEHAVKRALQQSGKMIPWQVITLSTNGDILDQ